eukprot:4715390-Prymnesium_polylepis.1
MALPVDTQRTRLTWPRPFLLRPWFLRLTVILAQRAGRRISLRRAHAASAARSLRRLRPAQGRRRSCLAAACGTRLREGPERETAGARGVT